MTATLCLFAKPPSPGKVKTRLAATLGPRAACELARAFLVDAWTGHDAWCTAREVRLALATTDTLPPDLLEPPPDHVWLQGQGDLGTRIETILRRALQDSDLAIAVGADSPGLPPRLLDEALAAHDDPTIDAVLGPAEDGGFYLLALRHCPEGLLADLPWSSPETFARTLARLEARGLRVAVLEPWFDVDEPDDLERLEAAIARGELCVPQTRATLERLHAQSTAPSATPSAPAEVRHGARHTAGALPPAADARPVTLSVILPVLDEAARITSQLTALLAQPGLDEILVVDGGSRDDTLARALRVADQADGRVRVLGAPRGRASQMNHGARHARGDTLLFLHADVRLPAAVRGTVDAILAQPDTVAGAFRTWTVDDTGQGRLGPLLHLADVRSRYSRLPYGDQALFLRRATFEQVGGFPEQPLMEDLELAMRLRRLGRIRVARQRVEVSGRRFIERPVFYTALVNIYPLLYRLGVSPRTLARLYRAVR